MKRIQNVLHEIGTYDINKISLSCFDDKRYILVIYWPIFTKTS